VGEFYDPEPTPANATGEEAEEGDIVRVTVDGFHLSKGVEFPARRYGKDSNGRWFIYEPRMSYCVPFGAYEIVLRAKDLK